MRKHFKTGGLYAWAPSLDNQGNGMPLNENSSYSVYIGSHDQLWHIDAIIYRLRVGEAIVVLDCITSNNRYDIRVLTKEGILGWARVGKEFKTNWKMVGP